MSAELSLVAGSEPLERHHPAQTSVTGLVDDSHAATAEETDHFVTGDLGPGFRAHRVHGRFTDSGPEPRGAGKVRQEAQAGLAVAGSLSAERTGSDAESNPRIAASQAAQPSRCVARMSSCFAGSVPS